MLAMLVEALPVQAISNGKIRPKSPAPSDLKRRFPTLERFKRWKAEDGFKYEWVEGEIIKTEGTKNAGLIYIVENINRRFRQTTVFQAETGNLYSEFDAQLNADELRKPDLGYLTHEQIRAAKNGAPLILAFAIEVIWNNDSAKKIYRKLLSYFRNGVHVVWHVFPDIKTVYVYTDPKKVAICSGSDICSAAPLVPDFEISADDIFA